jgi:hypothetical protein
LTPGQPHPIHICIVPISESPELTGCSYAPRKTFVQMSNLCQCWNCSSLMVVLPHYDLLPVTSVGCCWVSVKFPCWISDSCRFSACGHTSLSWVGGVSPGSGGSTLGLMPSREVHYCSREGYCSGPQHCVVSLLLTGFPAALLSRLPSGCLYCLGTDLLFLS